MDEDIKQILAEQTAAINEMKLVSQKTARYLKWLRVVDILKFLLILIPLIAAWLYLPQFLSDLSSVYSGLFPSSLMK